MGLRERLNDIRRGFDMGESEIWEWVLGASAICITLWWIAVVWDWVKRNDEGEL